MQATVSVSACQGDLRAPLAGAIEKGGKQAVNGVFCAPVQPGRNMLPDPVPVHQQEF